MSSVDTNNMYQSVPYDKCPTYIMHTDYDGENKTVSITDGDNTVLKIETGGGDSIKIDGVEYYNKTKVDNLLSSLESKLTTAISTAKSEVQAWATGQFQTKAV